MWRKLWNWLQGIWNRILDLLRPPAPRSEAPPFPRQLTEAGYERVMRRLLDHLDPDFDPQTLQEFLQDNRIREADLAQWLQRTGERWIQEGDQHRKYRLTQLGVQLQGDLAQVAQHLCPASAPQTVELTPDPAPRIPKPEVTPSAPSLETEATSPATSPTQLETRQQDIDRLFQQGVELAGSSRPREAITYWDMALALDDRQARLWANRGAALVDLNLHEQALISLNKALDLVPEDPLALTKRGEALNAVGRYPEALTDLQHSTQLDPNSVEAWYVQGLVLSQLNRFEEAIHCFDRALTLQPILHLAWLARAQAAQCSTYVALAATGVYHGNPALNQRGPQGALASLKAGQRHCTRQDHPLKWQELQEQIRVLSQAALS